MTTLNEMLRTATDTLAAADVPSPRHDAEALAAYLLGVPRSALAGLDQVPDQASYDALVARRAARVPLQHLIGRAAFRHIEVAVGPGVYVPRPETEVLVEWCLDAIKTIESPLVVDLCSGSGVIPLSIADEHPGARVHAVERDEEAFGWLVRNCAGQTRVQTHCADAAGALTFLDGTVDLVVSNPPYVPDALRDQVDPEVRDHDPRVAIWGGVDGLAIIRIVLRAARRLLRPGGMFAVEHDDTQGAAVPKLLANSGAWTDIADHPDLTGRDRFATARLAGP